MDTRQSTVHFGSSGNAPMQPSGGPDTKKILTLTAFALTIAILLCFCAVIITEIVYKVRGGSDGGEIADVGYKNLSLSSDEVNKGELLIINNSYPLKDKSNADELENVYNYNLSNPAEYYYLKPLEISLLPVTIEAFNKMTDALKKETGFDEIQLAYGYMIPKPETLECDHQHELGTSVDIKIITDSGTYKISDNEQVARWFADNAHKYGFINSDPNGEYGHGSDERVASTQFRYVGIAHATYIAAEGLDLEAYVELVKSKHKYSGNHLKINGADGSSYEVYYVASSGSTTKVPVPENYQYTVSGDNIGGFIVTVDLSKPVK